MRSGWLDAFWHAVAFLTRLPVPGKLADEAWAKSPAWYPLVGGMLGSLLALIAYAGSYLMPPWVLAFVLVTMWVYLTGGLHLDGLMDTADGFGSYRSKERILEIMKDSRVGAMGVLAAILLLGNKVAALEYLHGPSLWTGLVLAPVIGRTVMLAALYWLPYARQDGLAKSLREIGRVGKVLPFVFVALLLVIGAWSLNWTMVLVVLFPLLAAWWLVKTSFRMIGGCTGDVYGALCEVTEATVLLALVIGGYVGWN